MEVVLISAPTPVRREAARINAYLDMSLQAFHLRKPALPETAMFRLLEQIDPRHLHKITLHSHHQLAGPFGLQRLHYPEQIREITLREMLEEQREKGLKLSTSVHQVESLWELDDWFAYAFLSPIYPSISKKGYGEAFDAKKWTKVRQSPIPAYGLGGINHQNIHMLRQMGFQGAALLGSIWKNTHQEALKELEACLQLQP